MNRFFGFLIGVSLIGVVVGLRTSRDRNHNQKAEKSRGRGIKNESKEKETTIAVGGARNTGLSKANAVCAKGCFQKAKKEDLCPSTRIAPSTSVFNAIPICGRKARRCMRPSMGPCLRNGG